MALNLEKLLDKADLIDLATRAGAHIHSNGHGSRSSCPIHRGDNKTAFEVYEVEERQYWRCHTRCNDGGDAVTFMMRWKNLGFLDAVKELASIYHVPLQDLNLSEKDAAEEAINRKRWEVFSLAAHFFTAALWSPGGETALAYARGRGFTDETLRNARWGFTRSDQALAAYLKEAGIELALARDTGLVRGDLCDFTANANGQTASPDGYLIYPHYRGERVTYFSSRALSPVDPKDKSRNLPGPRQIYRAEVPGQDQVVLVEGPADAETLRQLQVSAWALCGLGSLPEDELTRLKNRKAIYLSTDSDTAGEAAIANVTSPVIRMVDALGPLTMVLFPMENGKDYNAWLQAQLKDQTVDQLADQLQLQMKKAMTWLELRLQLARDCPDAELDERMSQIGQLLSVIPEVSRSRYIRMTTKILGISRGEIQDLMATATGKNDGQILSNIRDGKLCFLGRPVGNFQAKISHELIIDDGQNPPSVRYSINGRLASGQPLEPVEIQAEEFDTLKWIPKHWGARPVLFVSRGQYHEVARAIQEISGPDLKRERVYTYTGWTVIDGVHSYLSASGRITPDGLDPTTRVDLGVNNLRYYELPAPVQGNRLYEAGQASLAFLRLGPREVTAPLWAAMYAAPLTSIVPMMAVMWVYGPTQSGKSTVTHLALTHFGPGFIQGRQYHAPTDWISTATSLEGYLFLAKDITMVIDDYAPQFASANDARNLARTAHYIVRSVGNRSSRGRARSDLTERTTRVPRGFVIATAENPLIGQSTVGRMVYLPIKRGDIFPVDKDAIPDQLNKAQEDAQAGKYAEAMSSYIQWLARNWEFVEEQFPLSVDAAAACARQQAPGLQNRLPDYYAILHAAQTLALRWYQDEGILSGRDAQKEAEANGAAILRVIQEQGEKIAQESPVRKFFEALSSLLERQKLYLAPRTQQVEYTPPHMADLVGWFDPADRETVYLLTETALMHTKAYWRELDENLDILPDALRVQMAQVPSLLTKRGDRNIEASVWVAGKTRRVLVVSKAVVFDLFGVIIENEPDRLSWKEPEEQIPLPEAFIPRKV